MSTPGLSQQAFDAAKDEFKKNLKDDKLFKELLATTSVDQVWKAITDIQAVPHAEKRLRHMAKTKRFIQRLSAYANTVDTFVQVKPDLLALIWGSVRLLLVWTTNFSHIADAICDVMEKAGEALPESLEMATTFGDNDKLKEILALLYRDILDFHAITLKFFRMSRTYISRPMRQYTQVHVQLTSFFPGPKVFFEAVWPQQQGRLDVVVSNIRRHTDLMRNEVTLQRIRDEFAFRDKALAEFDEQAEFRDAQKFQSLRTLVSPRLYDDMLDSLRNRSCDKSMAWLVRNKNFADWLDTPNQAARLLWLRGIPGAGKTFLSAAAVKEAKTRHRTLFVFASHTHQRGNTARSIFQSLLFQLSCNDRDARCFLAQSDERDLLGNTQYISERFKLILSTVVGPTRILVDGLDEMEAGERGILLQQLAVGLEDCSQVKILFSSRPEDDIANILDSKATSIRVDRENFDGIQAYINQRTESWMRAADFDLAVQQRVQHLLAPIAAKANGKIAFLTKYTKYITRLASC